MLHLLICHLLLSLPFVSTLSPHPKLLLISFDGFRYDLLNSTLVPNIYKWALDGVIFTNGIRSQYVSFTATNFMAIATGLYTESHGIVSNRFYDYFSGHLYDIWNSTKTPGIVEASLNSTWYRGEPIWLTNERADSTRYSATLYYPFGEVAFNNKPSRPLIYRQWLDYGTLDEWLSDVDVIIDLFTREEKPVNFLAWYIAEPDATLHKNGFYNGEYVKVLANLDRVFSHLLKRMKETGLDQEVNMIFTADHGHSQIDGIKNIMCVKDYINMRRIFHGEFLIYTFDTNHAKEVYKNLTSAIKTYGYKVKIYRKEEFPSRYHYTGMSSRIGDIILEPDIGWDIRFDCTREELVKKYGKKKLNSSTHGMNPEEPEMHATLVLSGPDIIPKRLVSRIPQNTDLYELMCCLLEIEPAPNNGTFLPFLRNVILKKTSQKFLHGFLIIIVPLFAVLLLVTVCVLIASYRRFHESTGADEKDLESGSASRSKSKSLKEEGREEEN